MNEAITIIEQGYIGGGNMSDKKLLICLDNEFYDLIKRRAKEHHISASAYIRLCVLANETKPRKRGKLV